MENVNLQKRSIGVCSNESRFDRFCFWFTTIDLLFLPYFTFISVSFSVPIITLWMILNSKSLLRDKEISLYLFIAFTMVMGTIVGLFFYGEVRFETTYSTSIKRFFQYLICFGYYFFYKSYFKRKYVEISKIMFVFIMYVAVFAIAYMIFPQIYATLKIALHPADNHTRRFLAGTVNYRFNYLWTDPNNIAYLVNGFLIWYVMRKECSFNKKIIVLLLSLLILASTVSNGGLIIFIFMYSIIILLWLFKKHKSFVKVRSLYFIAFLLSLVILIFLYTDMAYKIYETYILNIGTRFSYYLSSQNISGGRLKDISIALDYFNPIFLIIGSGKEGFTYENGHIYWICMYGFLSYIGFIWFMFHKKKTQLWKDYIWTLPFFVAFTMNIAIGEFKWMAIYFMLLAYSRYSINFNK